MLAVECKILFSLESYTLNVHMFVTEYLPG